MSLSHALRGERRAAILYALRQGDRPDVAADRFNVSRAYVLKLAKDAGIQCPRKQTKHRPGFTYKEYPRSTFYDDCAARRRQIRAAFDSGLLASDVAQRFGLTRERVRQILIREGVPNSRQQRTKKIPESCTYKRLGLSPEEAKLFRAYERLDLALTLFERHRIAGCWNWTGPNIHPCKKYPGVVYGRFGSDFAHRYFYDALKGEIPPGMTVDHVCFNTLCVNPDHLQLLTPAQNAARKSPQWHASQRARRQNGRRAA